MPLAVLLLDIDHFKAINDQFGHAAGDSAIKTFTQALLSRMRRTDMLGRIGGEEFVMLLPGTDQAGAMATAERLRADVETAEVAGEQAAIGLTVSIGVACCQAQDDSILTAIDRADRAMYQAKNSGRNRVATLEHPSPGCPGYLDTMPR
jgi:diguanylate cyclase (GGDEF)-like protein